MIKMLKVSAVATAVIGLTIWPYALVGVGEAYAEEVSAANLSLKKTYIKTENTALFLSTIPADAFTPTTVNCPRAGTCTLRVEVSSQFNGINPPDPNVAAVFVQIDNSTSGVEPNPTLGFDSTSTGGGSNVRTFSWIKKGLTSGQHTVDVEFFVTEGTAGSATRTLTIEIYKP